MKEGDLHNQKYILIRQIKTVLSNQTWLAEDSQKRIYILKFVKFPVRSQQQIDNQKIIFQKSRHENIVHIFQTFTCAHEANNYLVMVIQYCYDGDLALLIQKSAQGYEKLTLNNKIDYMLQMTKGVQYLHENNIAHRNIKPENIFRHNNLIKIADLDLACVYRIKSTQKLSGGAGLPIYKAPEAYQSNSYFLQSDIWSLGLVLVELILEKRLKDIESRQKEPCFQRQQIQTLVKKTKQVNNNLYDIIKGMLQIDIGQRIKAAQIILKLTQLKKQLKQKEEPIVKSKNNKPDKSNQRIYPTKPQMKILSYAKNSSREQKNIVQKQQSELASFQSHKNIKIYQPTKDLSRQYKKSSPNQFESANTLIQSKQIHQESSIAEFTLPFILPKDHFQQISELQLNTYYNNILKKSRNTSVNCKIDWVGIKTANANQRFKIRYSSQNDWLIIHYQQYQAVLGIQSLPVQIRLNWQTLEDLYVELCNLKFKQVQVTDPVIQCRQIKQKGDKLQSIVKKPAIIKFKAMIYKHYHQRQQLFFVKS